MALRLIGRSGCTAATALADEAANTPTRSESTCLKFLFLYIEEVIDALVRSRTFGGSLPRVREIWRAETSVVQRQAAGDFPCQPLRKRAQKPETPTQVETKVRN